MKIIGHRGAKGLAPENTLASFAKAIEHGVDELECDVRITEDNVAVLTHDYRLRDGAGRHYVIADHTYSELKAVKPDLTTLAELIILADKKTIVHIEVKQREPIEPVVADLQHCLDNGWRSTDFVLASKDFGLLRQLHRRLPEVPVNVIERWSGVRGTWHAKRLHTKRLSMNQLWLWRGFIAPMSRRGWQLSAYTVNDPQQARRWARYGLYAVITDYPDLFEQ